MCQYCGEVFDEPTVEEEKDVGYHGLSCPWCGEALGCTEAELMRDADRTGRERHSVEEEAMR